MAAEKLPFADGEFDMATRDRGARARPDPERTLAEMARCAERHLLVSVPREPLWRMLNMARGSYWSDAGEHARAPQPLVQALVRELLARHGEVVEVRSPFPWTMLLVRL